MFSAKKYLKIRKLDSILFGGPEAVERNYEKRVWYKSDTNQRERSRDSSLGQYNTHTDSIEEGNIWYEYQYDSEQNKIFFNSHVKE